MNAFFQSWYFAREYFFPQTCGVCGNTLLSGKEAWYGLCGPCGAELLIEPGERCGLCGRPLISEIGICLACRENAEAEPPACDRIISLFPYTGNYLKLLRSFKYGRSLGAGHFLAEKTTEAIRLLPFTEKENLALVPVPPRPGKIRKTGWDQIAALSKLLGQMPENPQICSCLKRKGSQIQKKLDRGSRKTNLRGCITVVKKPPRRCVLFDDVITTGSTMNVCASALKAAGAEKVFGVCLFYD